MPVYGTSLGAAYYTGHTILADAAHGAVAIEYDALALAQTPGLQLQNTTAATGGATKQYSPMLRFLGHGWAGVDTTYLVDIQNQPGGGASNGTTLAYYVQTDTSSYANFFNIEFDTILVGSVVFRQPSTTYMAFFDSGNSGFKIQAGVTYVRSSGLDIWQTDVVGIYPFSTLNNNCGTSSNRWLNVYAGTFIGSSLQTSGSTTAFASQATFSDSNSKMHYGVDASGLPSLGTRFEYFEDWLWMSTNTITASGVITTNPRWWVNVAGAGVGGVKLQQTLDSTFPAWCCPSVDPGTALNNTVQLYTGGPFVNPLNLDNLYIVMEWDACLSIVGANNVQVLAGLNASLSLTNPQGWGFRKISADNNWQIFVASTVGGANFYTSATYAPLASATPVANKMQTFRIEYYGLTSMTANRTLRFFIDGVIMATITGASVLVTNQLSAIFSTQCTTAGATPYFQIGPMRIMYNMLPTAFTP